MWLIDPKNGKKSATLTLFVIGFIVASLKLLLSDMIIYNISMSTFTGTDFALVIGALGSIYGFRKYSDKSKQNEINNN